MHAAFPALPAARDEDEAMNSYFHAAGGAPPPPPPLPSPSSFLFHGAAAAPLPPPPADDAAVFDAPSPLSSNVSAHDSSSGSPASPELLFAPPPHPQPLEGLDLLDPLPSGLCAEVAAGEPLPPPPQQQLQLPYAADGFAPLPSPPLQQLGLPHHHHHHHQHVPTPPPPPAGPHWDAQAPVLPVSPPPSVPLPQAAAPQLEGPRPVSVRSSSPSVSSGSSVAAPVSPPAPAAAAAAAPRARTRASDTSRGSQKRARDDSSSDGDGAESQADRERRRKEGNRAAARRHRLKNKMQKLANEERLSTLTGEVKTLKERTQKSEEANAALRAENERLRQQAGLFQTIVQTYGQALPEAVRHMVDKARRANVLMFTLFACFLLSSPYLVSPAEDQAYSSRPARGSGPSPAGRRLMWSDEGAANESDAAECWGLGCEDGDAPASGECQGFLCALDALFGGEDAAAAAVSSSSSAGAAMPPPAAPVAV